MFNISSYLEKFKKLGDAREKTKKSVADSFKEVSGIDVDQDSVKISNGEVIVSVAPTAHAIVFMKRESIIKKIKEKLPGVTIDRIRCR